MPRKKPQRRFKPVNMQDFNVIRRRLESPDGVKIYVQHRYGDGQEIKVYKYFNPLSYFERYSVNGRSEFEVTMSHFKRWVMNGEIFIEDDRNN